MESETGQCVRVLCPKKSLLSAKDAGLRWLIGSPLFVPPFTVVSSFRCLHALPGDPYSPDFAKEADEIRVLLLRGFDVIGAIFIGNGNWENGAWKAVEASNKIRKLLFGDGDLDLIGVATDLITGDIQFFVSHSRNLESVEAVSTVAYEDNPEKYVWEKGCLLRCELELKLPLFVLVDNRSDVAKIVSSLTGAAAAKLKDPHVAYLVEGSNISSEESSHSIVFHGIELDLSTDHSNSTLVKASAKESSSKALGCSHFCFKKKEHLIINYERATEQARYLNVSFKLDVLCYASEDFTIAAAISKSIVPGLVDQLNSIKKIVIPELLSQQPQRCPYHFLPPGLLHPITAMYDIRYGEIGMKQGEIRKFLHSRLGLPLDRPLLRIANALGFGMKSIKETHMVKCGSPLLKDVHTEIPSSGVFGDNPVREIHQALVDIGDKELSFVGPYEWIGAIELSYVLDKLLGVSCKIINVRSGEELPEKCRELSMRFETQGTPIMIGGGVLAYTLLGVDYNEMSGDCAFLILDPHYTGNDDLKKIVNGGWCGWKKAVDSKGRNFFLKDRTSSTISFHKGPTWFENPSDVLARGMRSYRDLANIEGMDVCR